MNESTNRAGEGIDRAEAEAQAREAIDNARNELQSLLENQKNAAVDQVRDVAAALRSTADELQLREQATTAGYVRHVADRIDHYSHRLREQDIRELGRSAQQFANDRPAAFVAGAAVVGFALARFLKSSNPGPSSTAARGDRLTGSGQSTAPSSTSRS